MYVHPPTHLGGGGTHAVDRHAAGQPALSSPDLRTGRQRSCATRPPARAESDGGGGSGERRRRQLQHQCLHLCRIQSAWQHPLRVTNGHRGGAAGSRPALTGCSVLAACADAGALACSLDVSLTFAPAMHAR